MSALPSRGSPPGSAAARADEPAAESTWGGRTAVVCRRRGEPAGGWWGGGGVPDHWAGREDDPARPGGRGRGVWRRADQAAGAAGPGGADTRRKKNSAIVGGVEGV